MKKILIALLLALALYGCNATSQKPQKITASEGKEMMEADSSIILIDVRTESEYLSGHISGAVLLPLDLIQTQAETIIPDKDTKIIVYCRSGNRSAQAVSILENMGYTALYDMGGIIDWPYGIVS